MSKNYRCLLSFLGIISIITPSYSYVTNASQCDNSVLSTYSGSANLTANWTGNNIAVTWYDGDTQYTNNSCTYGGNLTVPSAPSKTGYTFKGWRIRQTCELADVNFRDYGDTDSYWAAYVSNNGERIGYYATGVNTNENTGPTGLTEPGTWAAHRGNTAVYGVSYCSAKSVNTDYDYSYNDPSNWIASYDQLTSASGQKYYCWCKATKYAIAGGAPCSVTTSNWVGWGAVGVAPGQGLTYEQACANYCAGNCAGKIASDLDTDGDGDVDDDDGGSGGAWGFATALGVYDVNNLSY